MRHYLAICIQEATGGWRAIFPDVPGCEAKGFDLDNIRFAAESALMECLEGNETHVPPPSNDAIKRGNAWLAENQIDMSKAIVTIVAVP